MHSTPPSLLLRVSKQDEAAWNEFVDLYTPILLLWARKSRIPDHEAAELIQEIFVDLLDRLPSFKYDQQRSFRAWLITIIRNRWIDRVRRQKRVAPGDAGLSTAEAAEEMVELEEREFRDFLIRRALELVQREFGETTVTAFRMTALEDRSVADVAKALGMSEDAVYQARSRVMRKLREHLAGMWID